MNDAEYHAVLLALEWSHRRRRPARIVTDSQVVAYQVSGKYKCEIARLVLHRDTVRRLLAATGSTLEWRPRAENRAGWMFQRELEERARSRRSP